MLHPRLTFTAHLQLSDGLRVWDVSAGQGHSLLLADGDCVQPVLLYCGQQSETTWDQRQESLCTSPSRAEGYTVRPTLLPVCLEVRGRRTGRKRRTINAMFTSPCSCLDGLHQRRVQRRAELRRPGRPERDGFYLSRPRAGLQGEAVLLLAEPRQETGPGADTQQR